MLLSLAIHLVNELYFLWYERESVRVRGKRHGRSKEWIDDDDGNHAHHTHSNVYSRSIFDICLLLVWTVSLIQTECHLNVFLHFLEVNR